MDRIAAARGRVDEYRSFVARVAEAGPPCSSCRYRTLIGTCGNPAYAVQTFDPAKADYSESFLTPVSAARADDGLCGPEAMLFEPRTVLVTVIHGLGHGAWSVILTVSATLFALGLLWILLGR